MRRLALASLLAAGCAGASRRRAEVPAEPVLAEGWAADNPADPAAARQKALDDARREAVAQVARLYAPAQALAQGADAIASGLLSRPGSYIRKEEVLGERRDGAFVKVRLKAEIPFAAVEEELVRLRVLEPASSLGAPRAVVALADPDALAIVKETLEERGLRVAGVSSRTFVTEDRIGDLASASAWGREAGAGLVVAGRAAALAAGARGSGGLYSYRGRVELTATDAPQSRLLAGAAEEASGLAPEEAVARAKSVAAAARAAAEALAATLPRVLDLQPALSVKVYGIGGPEDLRKLEEELRVSPRVRQVRLRGYSRGNGWLLVYADRLSADELAAAALRVKSVGLELRSVAPDEVELVRRDKL